MLLLLLLLLVVVVVVVVVLMMCNHPPFPSPFTRHPGACTDLVSAGSV